MGTSGGIRPSGGSDALDEFTDSVTVHLPAQALAVLSISDTPSDEATDATFTDGVTTTIGTPAVMGAALLATFEGWWDATTWTSGDLANSGTGGAAPGVITGATFSVNKFVFDGVDDIITIADQAFLDFAAAEGFTIGVICSPTATVAANARMIAKGSGTPSYHLAVAAAATSLAASFVDAAGGTTSTTAVTSVTAGTKALHVATRSLLAGTTPSLLGRVTAAGLAAGGGNFALASSGAINNATALTIGGLAASNFLKMDFFGAFICHRPLSLTSLQLIAAYYGV